MADTRAFLDHLAADSAARPGGIATVGCCMGGRLALVAAGTYPERVVACHRVEAWPARHGFVFRDSAAYDAAAAERHWETLFALLEAKLK
jgi:dienelactone hydrolase